MHLLTSKGEGNQNIFTSKIKDLIERYKQKQKSLSLVGDFNLNSLDYTTKSHVQNFFVLTFKKCLFPLINGPTRITKTKTTAIDHIRTNTVLDFDVQSGITKN